MRKSVLLAAAFLGTTAACTSLLGDFTLGSSQGDGGSGEGGGEGGGSCNAMAPDVSVYVGQVANLNATSTSASATFSWTLSPPPNTTSVAMLQSPGSANPSFTPDVPGAFTAILVVNGQGCTQYSTGVTINAYLPQVLFAQGSRAASSKAAYVVSSQDGGAPTPVMCELTNSNVKPGDDVAHYAAYAGRYFDFWEAPAGQPSKYAGFTIDYTGNSYTTHLWAGTASSACMPASSAPADLGENNFGPGTAGIFGSEPSFSPDGSRFVIYDTHLNVISYSADGSGSHTIAPYSSVATSFDPSGRGATYIYPPRVAWKSSSMGVAWARSTTTGWEMVTASDTQNASPTTAMTCAGVTPRQIALLADGTVLASYRAAPGDAEDLILLKGDSGCTQVRNYTNLTGGVDAVATDFSVSPDGNTIAFLVQQAANPGVFAGSICGGDAGRCPGGNLYTVRVDGTGGAPKPVGTDAVLYGPRWIGGGTRLAYTRLDKTTGTDGTDPATSIIMINPDGTSPQTVATGDGTTTFVSTAGNAACSMGGRATPAAAGLLSLAALGLVRRRVKRTSRTPSR